MCRYGRTRLHEGGQHAPVRGGHYAPVQWGQYDPVQWGQYDPESLDVTFRTFYISNKVT